MNHPANHQLTFEQESLLDTHVQEVKDFLALGGVNVPFFIAGGSVFSIMQGLKDYDDLDVYFYKDSDLKKVKKAFKGSTDFVSPNAISFHAGGTEECVEEIFSVEQDVSSLFASKSSDSKLKYEGSTKLQFITKNTGQVEDILVGFDFNCSRCAYTSLGQLLLHSSFSDVIRYNSIRFCRDTLTRYHKYIEKKNAVDEGSEVLNFLYSSLITNIWDKYEYYYNDGDDYGYHILSSEIAKLNKDGNFEPIQEIHDDIIRQHPERCIELFMGMIGLLYADVPRQSPELTVARHLHNDGLIEEFSVPDGSIPKSLHYTHHDVQVAAEVYPEHFI